ncbi:hypothetical protein B9479_006656 [Cryptococcus floricola]|uniref:Uncharacterized protein n=1 Tax=Cryptococcus floricola TaxID=2591691 RepID=A0A5D3APH9_9TREE|nr:hypothetical protein B9479_006656 [Cryptococcus floricola]
MAASSFTSPSPPLSLIHLPPPPPKTPRPLSFYSLRSDSTLKAPASPPPSAFWEHRRRRSTELLSGLVVFAPTWEDPKGNQEKGDSVNSTQHIIHEGQRDLSPPQPRTRVEPHPPKTSPLTKPTKITMSAEAPAPAQKKGFFRRLSVATPSNNPTVSPNKLGKKKDQVKAGPIYEELSRPLSGMDSGPSAYRDGAQGGVARSKSKDRSFWGGRSKSNSRASTPNAIPPPMPTPPPQTTPIAASFARRPEYDSSPSSSYNNPAPRSGDLQPSRHTPTEGSSARRPDANARSNTGYGDDPGAPPPKQKLRQGDLQPTRQAPAPAKPLYPVDPSFMPSASASGSLGGPYPSMSGTHPYNQFARPVGQFGQPPMGSDNGPYPTLNRAPSQLQQPQSYQPQPAFKPFRTPSQNRAPVHPALASSPSPPPVASPPGSQSGHGHGPRSPTYGSPVEMQPGMVLPGMAEERRDRDRGLSRQDGRPHPQPLKPQPRSSSRTHTQSDLRSPPPTTKPLASPPPPLPGQGESIPPMPSVPGVSPRGASLGAAPGAAVSQEHGGRRSRPGSGGRPVVPPLVIPSDPRQPHPQASRQRTPQPPPETRPEPTATRSAPRAQPTSRGREDHRQSRFDDALADDTHPLPDAPPAYTPSPTIVAQNPKERERYQPPVPTLEAHQAEASRMRGVVAPSLPPGAAAPEVASPIGPSGQAWSLGNAMGPSAQTADPRAQLLSNPPAAAQSDRQMERMPPSAGRQAAQVQQVDRHQGESPRRKPVQPAQPHPHSRNGTPGPAKEMSEASKYAQLVAASIKHEGATSNPSSPTPSAAIVQPRQQQAQVPSDRTPTHTPTRDKEMERRFRHAANASIGSVNSVGQDGSPRRRPLPQPPTSASGSPAASPVRAPQLPPIQTQGHGQSVGQPDIGVAMGSPLKEMASPTRPNFAAPPSEVRSEKKSPVEERVSRRDVERGRTIRSQDIPPPVEKSFLAAAPTPEPKKIAPAIEPHPQQVTPIQNKHIQKPKESPLAFDFPRSPTLPPLLDPRNNPNSSSVGTSPLASPSTAGLETGSGAEERDPIARWAASDEKERMIREMEREERERERQRKESERSGRSTASGRSGQSSYSREAPLASTELPARGVSAQSSQSQLGYFPPPQQQVQPGRRTVSSPLNGRNSPRITSPLSVSSGQDRRWPGQAPDVQGTRAVSQPLPQSSSIPTLPPLLSMDALQEVKPRGERPPATLTFILLYTPIQSNLLQYLSINSFLSLTGASEAVNRRFSGEMVGRWIMREWGMSVGKKKGSYAGNVAWPNLTVWEGFLESLLHDPASYSTYPEQWHQLLKHLSLSHTLVVLHLRSLPQDLFPSPPPQPFDDDAGSIAGGMPNLPFSSSRGSLSSQGRQSRVGSMVGLDAASDSLKMPKAERIVELIMPEPLAAQPRDESPTNTPASKKFPPLSNSSAAAAKLRRRGSVTSLTSTASMPFLRSKKSSSGSSAASIANMPFHNPAEPMPPSGKASLPPVSYPTAKRYGFRTHGDPTSRRTSQSDSRPSSIFSLQSSASMSQLNNINRLGGSGASSASFAVDRHAPPVPGFPANLPFPPPIGGGAGKRGSLSSSSDLGKSSRRSDYGGNSPVDAINRQFYTPSPVVKRIEPAFDKPIPYILGRAPILRVFVPLSQTVQRWPSIEGAAAAVRELEKCGAMKRLKLGDLVANTAIKRPKTTEHVLIYVPYAQHQLLPLSYAFSVAGTLPMNIDAFKLPPSYYFTFLPVTQIIYLDLTPYGRDALSSLRLAYDRRDMTVSSGARVNAKRYLHIAGFEVRAGTGADAAWEGFVSLEGEGTAEGKRDIEQRLVGDGRGGRPVIGAWEIVREKCMVGNIWLKLVKEDH